MASPTDAPPLRFGIITPTYDRPDALVRSINSVRSQTYQHWLIVVIDDSGTGSVTAHLQMDDPRVRIHVNSSNSGTNRSRNIGIEALIDEVDFICFLDDDDCLDPRALEVAAEFLLRTGVSWAASRRISASTGESFTTVTAGQMEYDYIYDIMVEGRLTGDATHFVSSALLTTSGARLPDEHQYLSEWRFWAKVGSSTNLSFFEGAVTLGAEYGSENLSHVSRGNIDFRAREVVDLCRFFGGLDVPGSRLPAVTTMLRRNVAVILPRAVALRRFDLALSIVRAARPVDLFANVDLFRRLVRLLVVGSYRRVVAACRSSRSRGRTGDRVG